MSNMDVTRQTMVKRVNVIAPLPVRTLYPPMYGTYEGIFMSPANILKCLIHKARVEEILEDGSTIELNMSNYNTVNTPVTVVEPKLESRRTAVDPPTMNEIKTKTANLPTSHFLYDVKTENLSEDPVTPDDQKETDFKMASQEAAVSTHDTKHDMPIAEESNVEKKTEE